jgi:hypothetical protein
VATTTVGDEYEVSDNLGRSAHRGQALATFTA